VPDAAELHCCIPMEYPRGRFGNTLRRSTSETTYWNDWKSPPPW